MAPWAGTAGGTGVANDSASSGDAGTNGWRIETVVAAPENLLLS